MKRKYFKKCFIISVVIFSLLFCSTIIWWYYASLNNRRHDDQLNHVKEFEAFQKTVENSFNISAALARMITDHPDTMQFAASGNNYNQINFYQVSKLAKVLGKNQTEFSNLNLEIAMFTENNQLVICGNETMDKTNYTLLNDIQPEQVYEMFDKNHLPGLNYSLMPAIENNDKIYIAYRCIYPDLTKVYMCFGITHPDTKYISDFADGKHLIVSGDYRDSDIKLLHDSANEMTKNVFYRSKQHKTDIIYTSLDSYPAMVLASVKNIPYYIDLIAILCLMFVLGFLLALICSYALSNVLYRPIGMLVGILLKSEDITDKDEIAHIMASASNLMESNLILTQKLHSQYDTMKNRFVFDLINGFIWGNAIDKEIETFSLEFLKKPCIVILFDSEQYNGNIITPDTSESQMIFAMLKKAFCDTYNSFGIIISANRFLFITVNSDNIRQRIINVINTVRSELDLKLRAAMSSVISNNDDYKYVYSSLTGLLEQRYILGDYDILTMDDIPDKSVITDSYSIEAEHRLTEFMLAGESEKALLFLNQLLTRIIDSNTTDEQFKTFRFSILNTIRRILGTLKLSYDEIFSSGDIAQKIELCRDKDEFKSTIVYAFKMIAKTINYNISIRNSEITNIILEYIDSNLHRDLSMDDICNEFGMSSSTVARHLKEKDITFKSYFNEQRMLKAKEIIKQHPEYMVKDIAEMLGFGNIVTFNRLFKKHEGMSPGQYIENLKNNN